MTLHFDSDSATPQKAPLRRFRFSWFANFSGSREERAELRALPLTRNGWDDLFTTLKPALSVVLNLDGQLDLPVRLSFKGLQDFQPRMMLRQIPFLLQLKNLATLVEEAGETAPLEGTSLPGRFDLLAPLFRLAAEHREEPALDLLNMVDLGEAEAATAGWQLGRLKQLLGSPRYTGDKKPALLRELNAVEADLLGQLAKHEELRELEAQWRGLKAALACSGDGLQWSLVDCCETELCDAVFLTHVKPEGGSAQASPQQADLLLTSFTFDLGEDRLHRLHHLTRMAESLQTPFLLNAHANLFGLKNNRMLQHFRDISGKMAGPAHAKWRKQRDQSGARWAFMTVNRFALNAAEEEGEAAVWAPGALAPALILGHQLLQQRWPGELLSPLGELEFSRSEAVLTEQQGIDLAYEGFCGITQNPAGRVIQMQGMASMARVTHAPGESPSARDFVEFTLPYAFFVGCLSRFIAQHGNVADLPAALARFVGLPDAAAITQETQDGLRLFRLQPPFTVFRVRPDIVLASPL